MKFSGFIKSGVSYFRRYQFQWVMVIAISWTFIDYLWLRFFQSLGGFNDEQLIFHTVRGLLLRSAIVFVMSSLMGYILIFKLRQVFRDNSLLISIFMKTCILLVASLFLNFLLHFTYSIFTLHYSILYSIEFFFGRANSFLWVIHHSIGWIILFLFTQLAIDFYEKYSPGVFWDIMIGRYIGPKSQKRIVMFLDLKDSTPIAERLDSKKYFSFIRDFIYYVSIALLEYHGRIYQYVGDEIVVSWKYSEENRTNCINALMLAALLIKRNSRYFLKKYGVIPEFKVGIHTGEITVGEIGIIKKDIAMSGDIMNTAARIRTACTELNHDYLASKDFIDGMEFDIKPESIGAVDLKGKSESVELYALRI